VEDDGCNTGRKADEGVTKSKQLTRSRQGAQTRKVKGVSFLCDLCGSLCEHPVSFRFYVGAFGKFTCPMQADVSRHRRFALTKPFLPGLFESNEGFPRRARSGAYHCGLHKNNKQTEPEAAGSGATPHPCAFGLTSAPVLASRVAVKADISTLLKEDIFICFDNGNGLHCGVTLAA